MHEFKSLQVLFMILYNKVINDYKCQSNAHASFSSFQKPKRKKYMYSAHSQNIIIDQQSFWSYSNPRDNSYLRYIILQCDLHKVVKQSQQGTSNNHPAVHQVSKETHLKQHEYSVGTLQ